MINISEETWRPSVNLFELIGPYPLRREGCSMVYVYYTALQTMNRLLRSVKGAKNWLHLED